MINLAAQSNVTISTLSARGLYTTSETADNDNSNPYSILEVHAGGSAPVGPCRWHRRHVLPRQQRPGGWIQGAGGGARVGLSARTFARQREARRHLSPLEGESKSEWLAGAGAPRLFHAPAGEGKTLALQPWPNRYFLLFRSGVLLDGAALQAERQPNQSPVGGNKQTKNRVNHRKGSVSYVGLCLSILTSTGDFRRMRSLKSDSGRKSDINPDGSGETRT